MTTPHPGEPSIEIIGATVDGIAILRDVAAWKTPEAAARWGPIQAKVMGWTATETTETKGTGIAGAMPEGDTWNFERARGASGWKPGDLPAEKAIRLVRDG